jgi:hypothetical protein
MANTAEIIVKVVDQSSAGLSRVNNQVSKFNNDLNKANNLSSGLTGTIAKLGGAIAAAFSVKAVIGAIREFEDLRATLTTIEGSAESAGKAFDLIKKFTQQTTFQLAEVTNGFITFRNAGLSPTEEFMTNIGNIAAGMGKRFDDVARAVFNATTGEFEMLKQLGIKVKTEGEKLNVTFKGVSLEIANDGKSIIDVIEQIGKTEFAGGIQRSSQTLSGAFSNLQDQFSIFASAIGEGGLTAALTEVSRRILAATDGSESLAHKIGGVLGPAILFVVDHFELFATAIGVIAGLGFIKYIQNLTIALKAMAMSNPFTAIATIATVAAYAIYDNWGGIKKWFGDLFNSLEIGWLKVKKGIYSALDAAPFADFSKEVAETENAISDLEKEIKANAEATEKNSKATKGADKALSDLEKQIVNNTKDTKKLTGETGDLTEQVEDANKNGKNWADTIVDLGKGTKELSSATKKVTTAYKDYIKALEEENRLAKLGNDEREIQIAINKALEATAKDLKKTVEQLTDTERRQVEERVRGLIEENQEIEKNKKKQEETVNDLKKLYDDYTATIKDYRNSNLSNAEQYAAAVEKLETDLANGLKLTEKEKDDYLRALRSKYVEDYTKQAEEFRVSQLTETQKYYEEIEKVEELYRAGAIQSEEEKASIINGIRGKYSQEYIKTAQEQANKELGIFGAYSVERKKLDDALNAGIIKDYDVYLANRRKMDKDYADAAASEYSSLYGLLEDKTKELTGLTDKEFGVMRDIVKLTFGVDVNDIIKGVFANGIGYLKSFIMGGQGELGGFSIFTGGIFDGIGNKIDLTFVTEGLKSVGSFALKALGVLGDFGASTFDLFSSIGSFILRNFSSLFDSVKSGASALINAVGSIFSRSGGGGGNTFSSLLAAGASFIPGVGGIISGAVSVIGKIFGFDQGGAFSNGVLTKYAQGGIVNSPTLFPMANGAGLMGEAGPEAILPLERIGGALGVRSTGSSPTNININFTVNTMDARDFDSLLVEKKQLITNIVSSAVRQGNRSFA